MSDSQQGTLDGMRHSSGTVLESADEIRQAIDDARRLLKPIGSQRRKATIDASVSAMNTQPFHSQNRPPMAVLGVRFDEEDTGQELAVFTSPFVIGRVEGNLVIEHDSEISGRHAELI